MVLRTMAKKTPPRVPVAQLAYLAVFGVFVFIYLGKVMGGSASDLDWITLGIAVLLLLVAAYRVIIALGKPDA